MLNDHILPHHWDGNMVYWFYITDIHLMNTEESSSSCRAASMDIPDPLLPLLPYRSSLLAGPQGYILYPHRAAVCRFKLVTLLLLSHVRGSIGEHHMNITEREIRLSGFTLQIYTWWTLKSHHHHHHVVLPAWISLTLSCHSSLSFITSGQSSGLHPVSSQSCYVGSSWSPWLTCQLV